MHKNLITQISFEKEINRMDTLKGFQQIMSDFAYGTHYTIYGKFKGEFKLDEQGNELKDFFKMEEAVFYLQNYSGQVTVGLVEADPVIEMAYYEDLEEPVYFVNLSVTPLSYNPFFPAENKENVTTNEELVHGEYLILTPLALKKEIEGEATSKLIINNFLPKNDNPTEKEQKLQLAGRPNTMANHRGFLNLNYKILFHLHYLPFVDNLGKRDEELKKSIFLDEKNYERQGEEIIEKIDRSISTLEPIAPRTYIPNLKKMWNAVIDSEGRIRYDKNCKSGITDGKKH
jgi:hypothetical protein